MGWDVKICDGNLFTAMFIHRAIKGRFPLQRSESSISHCFVNTQAELMVWTQWNVLRFTMMHCG